MGFFHCFIQKQLHNCQPWPGVWSVMHVFSFHQFLLFGPFGLNNRNLVELGIPNGDGKMVVGDHKGPTGDSTVAIPQLNYGSVWDPLQ